MEHPHSYGREDTWWAFFQPKIEMKFLWSHSKIRSDLRQAILEWDPSSAKKRSKWDTLNWAEEKWWLHKNGAPTLLWQKGHMMSLLPAENWDEIPVESLQNKIRLATSFFGMRPKQCKEKKWVGYPNLSRRKMATPLDSDTHTPMAERTLTEPSFS